MDTEYPLFTDFVIGDLVVWKTVSGPVKGRVTDIFNDIDGWCMAFNVTSLRHAQYALGTELVVTLDCGFVHKRERYSRGKAPVQPS